MFKSINGGVLPQRATKYSAGFDVFANEDVIIGAGETKLIGLGIELDGEALSVYSVKKQYPYLQGNDKLSKELVFMMTSYFALHIRSSLRAKGLTSLGTGVVDIDYRDEIKMVINFPYAGKGPSHYEIKKGDKIGQLILCRHEGWLLPSEYTKDKERNGGFGSTDV